MIVTHAALEKSFHNETQPAIEPCCKYDNDGDGNCPYHPKTKSNEVVCDSPVKPPSLFTIAEDTFKDCLETLESKNHDYSKGEDEFRNFNLITHIRPKLTIFDGILVRLCDKFARISNLVDNQGKVKDESVLDTIDDAINYFVILKSVYIIKHKLYLKEKETKI